MTPAGHISISYLFGRYFKYISIPAIIIGGILPDMDFIFLFAPWFNRIHRVITHNLTFLLLTSAAGALIIERQRKAVIFASLIIGGLLHLFFDSCVDGNPSNGLGVAIFWPFSDYFFCPVNFYSLINAGFNSRWLADPAAKIKIEMQYILWEMPLYLLSIILFLKSKKNKKQRSAVPGKDVDKFKFKSFN